mmetsp:Transcript_10667/g.32059  ORF Transcript_10667/g.32059 Transcript_10667/m.32059 type:complete len:494 (+) Transcript_10667:670-2151(+)
MPGEAASSATVSSLAIASACRATSWLMLALAVTRSALRRAASTAWVARSTAAKAAVVRLAPAETFSLSTSSIIRSSSRVSMPVPRSALLPATKRASVAASRASLERVPTSAFSSDVIDTCRLSKCSAMAAILVVDSLATVMARCIAFAAASFSFSSSPPLARSTAAAAASTSSRAAAVDCNAITVWLACCCTSSRSCTCFASSAATVPPLPFSRAAQAAVAVRVPFGASIMAVAAPLPGGRSSSLSLVRLCLKNDHPGESLPLRMASEKARRSIWWASTRRMAVPRLSEMSCISTSALSTLCRRLARFMFTAPKAKALELAALSAAVPTSWRPPLSDVSSSSPPLSNNVSLDAMVTLTNPVKAAAAWATASMVAAASSRAPSSLSVACSMDWMLAATWTAFASSATAFCTCCSCCTSSMARLTTCVSVCRASRVARVHSVPTISPRHISPYALPRPGTHCNPGHGPVATSAGFSWCSRAGRPESDRNSMAGRM